MSDRFLSAEELGVSEITRSAAIVALFKMEDFQVPQKVNMFRFGRPLRTDNECGSPGCILGIMHCITKKMYVPPYSALARTHVFAPVEYEAENWLRPAEELRKALTIPDYHAWSDYIDERGNYVIPIEALTDDDYDDEAQDFPRTVEEDEDDTIPF